MVNFLHDFWGYMMRLIQLTQLFIFFIIFFTCCIVNENNQNACKNMTTKHKDVFLREYSSEHLQKNPHQTIQKILIQIDHFPLRAKKIECILTLRLMM